MRGRLANTQRRIQLARDGLPSGLQAILDAGIHLHEGIWVFRAMEGRRTSIMPTMFPDATGYECLLNKFHIEDYLNSGEEQVPVESQLSYGFRFIQLLQQQLPREERFTLILSCDDERCVLRFHKTRPGEQWLAENLEAYQEEAILEVSNQEPGLLAL
jgi:hypothetical protein